MTSFLDDDPVFHEEAFQSVGAESGSAKAVDLRVQDHIPGRAKVGPLQAGPLERGTGQVAIGEDSLGEIGFHEFTFHQAATMEGGALERELEEGTVVQLAILEGDLQEKGLAFIQAYPQHLAFRKANVPERGLPDPGQAEITAFEGTGAELAGGQIGF